MKTLPILALSALAAIPASAAVIISGDTGNGNFETPNVTTATPIDTTGTAIANWAYFGTARDTGVYDQRRCRIAASVYWK